jgi:hypothetical protein
MVGNTRTLWLHLRNIRVRRRTKLLQHFASSTFTSASPFEILDGPKERTSTHDSHQSIEQCEDKETHDEKGVRWKEHCEGRLILTCGFKQTNQLGAFHYYFSYFHHNIGSEHQAVTGWAHVTTSLRILEAIDLHTWTTGRSINAHKHVCVRQ